MEMSHFFLDSIVKIDVFINRIDDIMRAREQLIGFCVT